MSIDSQNHQAIRGLLENALHQVVATQTQVTSIEGQLHEIKSQIDLSLESIDSVLKQLEASEQKVEKVRSDVAATLGEMFEHMSRIVNGAREQMMQGHADEASSQQPVTPEMPTGSVIEESIPEKSAIEHAAATPVDETTSESLSGGEAGQRATASLNEMIATIDETNAPPETEVESQIESPPDAPAEALMETPPETLPVQETPATPETEPQTSTEPETPKGPGSADSLSALLAKARAATGAVLAPATEAAPIVGEEEDAQTVNELLHNTSGSFVAQ